MKLPLMHTGIQGLLQAKLMHNWNPRAKGGGKYWQILNLAIRRFGKESLIKNSSLALQQLYNVCGCGQ